MFLHQGFTLVELLLTLLLVDVALLTLVGTIAVITRQLGDAAARSAAFAIARNRVERLTSQGCASAASGDSVPAPGMHEWWSATPAAAFTLFSDSVELTTRHGVRTIVLRGRTAC